MTGTHFIYWASGHFARGSTSHNLTTSFRDYFQYQRIAEPVYVPDDVIGEIPVTHWDVELSQPTEYLRHAVARQRIGYTQPIEDYETADALTPEVITLDKWHAPLGLPSIWLARYERQPRNYAYPCNVFEQPQAMVAETVTIDMWWSETRTPRWTPRPLLPLPPLEAIDAFALDQAEDIKPDKWEVLWRTPRWSVRVPVQTDPSAILEATLIPVDEAATSGRVWHVQFSDPVRPKFRPYLFQTEAFQLDEGQQPEPVTVDRFYSALSLPLFPVSRRYTAHFAEYHKLQITDFDEVISVASFTPLFSVPFPTPVWVKQRASFDAENRIQLDESQQLETICCDVFARWGQLMRLKPVRLPHLPGEMLTISAVPVPGAVKLGRKMLAGGLSWF